MSHASRITHHDLPTTYNQKKEQDIYKLWEMSGLFNPDNLTGKSYTIIMPPPNANAPLHLGHALFLTLEDIMIRYHRMKGEKTLWLPGTDHAGFETQAVFEKKLAKEGRSRFQMTRQEFYKESYEFVMKNKEITEDGIRRVGSSCDWSRNIFTLDQRIVNTVYETFKQMHEDGLIYRGSRICNWCTKHQTALSDLETKYEQRTNPLYYIKYGPFVLATVRPETKFGDTAVAVNPKDKRYKEYVGKKIQVKGLLGNFKISVIADEAVDATFGTGVVKVTPAHDAVDFEIWQRHKDEIPGPLQIIDQRGRMDLSAFANNKNAKKYHGLKVLEARVKVVEDLQAAGLIEKIEENYQHNIQLCYKCNNVIEPLILPQWFAAMTKKIGKKKSLRDMAVTAVKTKKIQILPKRFEKVYMHWMKNLRDWPISRQIWWGIPIPVYYCGGVEKSNYQKMGFSELVVPRLLTGMTRTYRIHDHHYKVGDQIAFENSQTKILLGFGTIIKIERMPIKKIPLKDSLHKTEYKSLKELLTAFKRHYSPAEKITGNTEALLYTYTFDPIEKTKDGCGQIIISNKKPEKCPACGNQNLQADPDTFDTWFSSGQWPYATLLAQKGSNLKIKNQKSKILNPSDDFNKFYPTDVMETGWDILFFWVARMIMFGLYKTDKAPFKTVYLHGLLRDKDRQKMSKSKGNTIDPLGMIDQYGADAVRMSLIVGNLAGNDIVVSEEKIRGYRNFANKIWNAARFVISNCSSPLASLAESMRAGEDVTPSGGTDKGEVKLTEPDQKILKELKALEQKITKQLEKFDFAHAAEDLYHYFWHTFADKIIEEAKIKLADPKSRQSTQLMLKTVLENSLRLLHPFMPFVTEAVWQLNHNKLLMIEPWPKKSNK